MDGLSETDILLRARRALLSHLAMKAEEGSITVNEMAVLRNLLRDNGLVFAADPIPKHDPAVPAVELPDLDPPDYA